MSGTKPQIYYWDSCVYLAWLKEEQDHGKVHINAMAQILRDNFEQKTSLFTSVITLTEVLESTLLPDKQELFKKMFRASNHTLHDVDPPVAHKAREFRQRVHADTGKVLSTPDAIHLATAVIYEADAFHTFDGGQKSTKYAGLLDLSGLDCVGRLIISKPILPQGILL